MFAPSAGSRLGGKQRLGENGHLKTNFENGLVRSRWDARSLLYLSTAEAAGWVRSGRSSWVLLASGTWPGMTVTALFRDLFERAIEMGLWAEGYWVQGLAVR